jgi:D-threo-aldose 1-dehydrogenase
MTVRLRQVGRSRLRVPPIGLGTAHLGELYARVPEAQSQATLQQAWHSGVRFYDTAPWYGRGLAEHRLGQFLRTQDRASFTVNTKIGRTLSAPRGRRPFDTAPWTGGLPFEVTFDYSYDGVMRAHEQSLQRLALPSVDSLVIHDLDTKTHAPDQLDLHRRQLLDQGGMRALDELRSAGDIDGIGIGVNRAGELSSILEAVDVDFVLMAMPYTLLDQASLHTDMADCLRRGISVVVGSPFASGILATGSREGARHGYRSPAPEILEKVNALESACSARGTPLATAALHFVLAHPAAVSVIPGATRPQEVEQNVASLRRSVPNELWGTLKASGLVAADAPVPGEVVDVEALAAE